jgi:lipoate-protein ligase A
MRWRLVTEDGVSASLGLAGDEALAWGVGTGESPATLRLYTYRPHCALVGRFQRVENEIHIDYCRTHGIEINRRPTGGGAILMGTAQLGVALMLGSGDQDPCAGARTWMGRFSEGLIRALHALGVKAHFRGKNDIEVGGRKIAGLGICRVSSGAVLFHASLLVDLDVPLMLRVLNTPFEKIRDREIAIVGGRTSTVRQELGCEISVEDARRKVAEGYAAAFNVDLAPGDFTVEESRAIEQLRREKYLTEKWIFQTTEVADRVGSARMKTPAGLLDVTVTMAGRTLKAVFIGGDFFAAENVIAELEASLRWHSSEPQAVAGTLQKVCALRGTALSGISLEALAETIQTAVRQARVADDGAPPQPYGCFVGQGTS